MGLGMPDSGSARRDEARQVGCPRCGAGAGEKCLGGKGRERERNHAERVDESRRQCSPSIPYAKLIGD